MALLDRTTEEGTITACLEEIDAFVATLNRYPPDAVAAALSVHLQTVLCALVECNLYTAEQVRVFLQELEGDVCAQLGERPQDKLDDELR